MRFTLASALFTLVLFALLFPTPMQARWNCPQYAFLFDSSGNLSVRNAGIYKEPAQVIDVLIDGELVGTFRIDNLLAGETAFLGNITPLHPPFHWEIRGSANFRAFSTVRFATTREPLLPLPLESALICVTIDRGYDLLGKLQLWYSNESGKRLALFDGEAEIDADGVLTLLEDAGELRQGWFVAVDENDTQALLFLEVGSTEE